MLQIKLSIIIILFLANTVCSKLLSDTTEKWLLEDAYTDEYMPLSEANYVLPEEVNDAIRFYNEGQYRRCIEILEKERRLELPDNRLDFLAFLLGESYRQLRLRDNALVEYQYITENFPKSDKIPPGYFRIMEFAADRHDIELVDSIYQEFRKRFLKHPLYNTVLYTYGKLLYRINRFEDALVYLSQVNRHSSQYLQAQFVMSLCYIKVKDINKALQLLDYVKKNTVDNEIASESSILVGDINFSQNNLKAALAEYKSIPQNASRYHDVLVKIAKTELDLGNSGNAMDIARQFLRKYKTSENYFEMASILEQAYAKLGEEKNASDVDGLIQHQIVNVRLAFEIFQEIDHLVDLSKNYQILEFDAVKTGNDALTQYCRDSKKKIRDIDYRLNNLLSGIDPSSTQKYSKIVPHLAERRYLALLKKEMGTAADSINIVKNILKTRKSSKSALGQGMDEVDEIGELDDQLEELQKKYTSLDREYLLILKECLGGESGNRRADEDLQTKFVDWAFMKYQDKKETLKKMAEEISQQKKNALKSDSSNKDTLQEGKKLSGALTQLNYDKLAKTIADERNRLADHIEMMQEVYKKNIYNPQILLRLAELYFDRAGDEFNEKLREYEKNIARDDDTTNFAFPEYDLDQVISIYDSLVSQYPTSDLADNALFYKAMALQKEGDDVKCNKEFENLVENYPESEFFVEANMNIGRYYFEHPKIENNSGYKIAEDAYRRVLFYRDHPQFVQALYHLGWCYYMQDKFDEAIAVFKYLVEEAKLDFDASKIEEKQVVNPLLRGEAIDYIAISFDEEGKVDDVLKFLQLIGNDDYSALVLKRIAELREEDLDAQAAINMYRRLVNQFPLSTSAPEASIGIIRQYETKDIIDSALVERENFFSLYCSGSKWNTEVLKRDSTLVARVDSIAIAMGLFVADAKFRQAEKSLNNEEFRSAAECYRKVVEKYPDVKGASEARWNLAVILETKLNDKPSAYNEYIAFSRQMKIDSSRREQAALNAIAIAQSLLPPDTTAGSGALDFSSGKVVEAVNNYMTVFPGGGSYNKVLLGMGAIYFNRHMYQKAEDVYKQIAAKGPTEKEYYESLLFIAQCNFGLEKWPEAITAFEKVRNESENQNQKNAAYKFLLQSEFLNAKKMFTDGKYQNAADAFRSIEDRYPASEYGDIVLFNAAEALEKLSQWTGATENYYDLVKKYPSSKLAPDALFNAAADFEKSDKYVKAAECYESLVSNYSSSDKAKDALFNLGLCYEKLGKLDEMAQVNERYSALYPGEKDIESMILRSAAYYSKTGVYDKAVNVYRNFIRRFPDSQRSVEAFYMIAKCTYDKGDKEAAIAAFNQTEQLNLKLDRNGQDATRYYASEAAFYTGMIKREKFNSIKLLQPDNILKASMKEKTECLNESVKAFQRVIQYQSERMFEAAYRVGQLYEEMAAAYRDQERARLDPIQAAVQEKDILTVSSQLMQKTFIPYCKTIEISNNFDSLSAEQKTWIQKAKEGFAINSLNAGQLLFKAVGVMNDAPIPKEIQAKPLHYYQYLKQLLETLAPFKMNVANYYGNVIDKLDTLKLAESASAKECANQYAYVNYLIGDAYDKLSSLILSRTKDITKNMSESEREDLLFQLEDIVYELQDKAILEYENALGKIEKKQLATSQWYTKIIECLARLSPDKYGASFYKSDVFVSGAGWVARTDNIENWKSSTVPKDGWKHVDKRNDMKLDIAGGSAGGIWGGSTDKHVYFWKNIFLNGTPRNGSVYVRTNTKYNLYVNEALTLKDTLGGSQTGKIDSATGIIALLRGGDNVIAVEADAINGQKPGICIVFSTLLDTTAHYQPSIVAPNVYASNRESEQNRKTQMLPDGKNRGQSLSDKTEARSVSDITKQYKNRNDLLKAIADYESKERELSNQIRLEEGEIRRLKQQNAELDAALQSIKFKNQKTEKTADGKPAKVKL